MAEYRGMDSQVTDPGGSQRGPDKHWEYSPESSSNGEDTAPTLPTIPAPGGWPGNPVGSTVDHRMARGAVPGSNARPDSQGAGFGDYRLQESQQRLTGARANTSSLPRWRQVRFRLLAALVVVVLIVGFCGTNSVLTVLGAMSAARDAKVQVAAIETLLKDGSYTDTNDLTTLQARLVALDGDLSRMQSALPGPVAQLGAATSVTHALRMATSLVGAGRNATEAALILVPHLKAFFSDINSNGNAAGTAGGTANLASGASSGGSTPNGLTMDEVTHAQQDIALASTLVLQALTERQYIHESDLNAIGLGSVIPLVQKLDRLAPQLPTALRYANTVMTSLPKLLGITRPAHYLFFDMDSDELRPSGGFLGNYAVVTVQQGRLVGGIHLKDVTTLDCPAGRGQCPYQAIPAYYAWMDIAPSAFGMRDANLSPDYPTSAKLVMAQYQRESGRTVDGVVMITPAIIKEVLAVTGSIAVPGFSPAVNAKNLQDVIHYYHIISGTTNADPGTTGTTSRKVIDTLLGSALLRRVASLSAHQQNVIVRALLQGIVTKDVQVYFVEPAMEGLLSALHRDAAIPMPVGTDGLMATDANVGASYYNADMQESVADTITFDRQGNALHNATFTYRFPVVNHLYTDVYANAPYPVNWYTDVVRVVVPAGATLLDQQVVQCPTCFSDTAPEQGHQVWSIRIQRLLRGGSVVLHFRWMTPHVLQPTSTGQNYHLQLYRQAGNRVAYSITIIPPTGSQIVQPVTDPLETPATAAPGAKAVFTTRLLTQDTLLSVSFTGR
jgi:hypothetical protein